MTFEPAKPSTWDYIIVGIQGMVDTGKSRFAMTFPGPIAYIALDEEHNLKGVVDPFLEEGKEINISSIFCEPYDVTKELEAKKNGIDAWTNFVKDYREALGTPTIVIDTFTKLYEWARLAAFGKVDKVPPNKYGPLYTEMDQLFSMARRAKSNLVVISHMKEVWENKGGIGEPTGVYAQDGYRKVPERCQFVIEMSRSKEGFVGEFVKFKPRRNIIGTKLINPEYSSLMNLIKGESK